MEHSLDLSAEPAYLLAQIEALATAAGAEAVGRTASGMLLRLA